MSGWLRVDSDADCEGQLHTCKRARVAADADAEDKDLGLEEVSFGSVITSSWRQQG